MRTLVLCVACLSMLASFAIAPLLALDPGRATTQFAHRLWGEKEGYPGLPYAIAQTQDGFLWLGVGSGLYRFDGVHFEHYEPASGGKLRPDISSLLALPDGRLWIGYMSGGISVLQNNKITNYGEAEGVPGGTVWHIVQDHDGGIWATTGHGLVRYNRSRWEAIGSRWNCPKKAATGLFVDSRGTVWVAIGNSILYLKHGSNRFEDTGDFALEVLSMAEAPDGKVWMADAGMAVRPIATPGSPRLTTARCQAEVASKGKLQKDSCNSAGQLEIQVGSAGMLFDRNGSLWMTTIGDGLRRSPFPARLKPQPIKEFSDALEHFTSKDGLSADYSLPIFEDREGNIWVGTRDGLDEFSDTALVPVIFPTGTNQISLAPDARGYVWATINLNHVARIYGDSMNVPLVPIDGYSAYRDPGGSIWLRGVTDLSRLKGGKFQFVTRLPTNSATPSPEGVDMQIVGDNSGRLWAFVKDMGFLSLEGHSWKALQTPPEITKLTPSSAYPDATGRIWIGFENGSIATLDKGTISTYPAGVVRLGTIATILERGHQIWVSGGSGLALLEGGRFRHIKPSDTESFFGVSGVVDAGNEGLWLNERHGVLRIPAGEVSRAIQDPSYRVHYETFDSSDGLPGKIQSTPPYPTAIRGTDGRLWFAAKKGVAWIDPSKTSRNILPPPVWITTVLADGLRQSNMGDLKLPAQTAAIQINYIALSFSMPERVRFRYKLDGVDKGLQDPGTRREAYYSRLPPGHYKFHVIACNNDGVWNEQGATLDFSVLPAWYQTNLFRIFCVVTVLFIVWAIHVFRVRQIARAIDARFDERLAERTRIAGDLHDTLLQTIQGSKLVVNDALNKHSDEVKMRHVLQQLSLWLEQATQEGRLALNSLRTSTLVRNDLADAFQQATENGPAIGQLVATLSVVGNSREMHPIVRDEIYRIGYEAIRNAQTHSGGTRLEVELRYGLHLVLRVRDNGVGIDPTISAYGKVGHFGLQGMRERAARIGAKLTIASSAQSGTDITLAVPGAITFINAKTALVSRLRACFRRETRTPRSK